MSDDKRQDIKNGTDIEERSKLSGRLNRLKSLCEILGIVIAVGLSAWANIISHKAVKLTAESLRKQELEFRIRNRPYVILDNPRFSDKTTYDSVAVVCSDGSVNRDNHVFQKSITVSIKNISEIPAQLVNCVITITVGESKGRIDMTSAAVLKGSDLRYTFGLPDDWYRTAMDGSKELSVEYSITYSGMLGENQNTYLTNVKVLYYPKSSEFGYIKYDIK